MPQQELQHIKGVWANFLGWVDQNQIRQEKFWGNGKM